MEAILGKPISPINETVCSGGVGGTVLTMDVIRNSLALVFVVALVVGLVAIVLIWRGD